MQDAKDYNNRLFGSNSLRSRYHMARFLWVEEVVRQQRIDTSRFLELGCFDGRLLDHIPMPTCYVGIDGNWEKGLDIAKARFADDDSKEFVESLSPDSLKRFDDGHSAPSPLSKHLNIFPQRCSKPISTKSRGWSMGIFW